MSADIPSPTSNPFQAPPSASPPRRRTSAVWVIGIGLLASFCLCGGPCVALIGFCVYQVAEQRDDVESVVDQSLKDIAGGNTDDALGHWSQRAIDHKFV